MIPTTEAPGMYPTTVDMVAHIDRQRAFSLRVFGPGVRTAGVLDHIRKELREIEADPLDLREWIDVVLLALDGAWRAGYSSGEIAHALLAKQERNERREWPDWRSVPADRAIEHVRHDTGVAVSRIQALADPSVRARVIEWLEEAATEASDSRLFHNPRLAGAFQDLADCLRVRADQPQQPGA